MKLSKEELLQELQEAVQVGVVSREEIDRAARFPAAGAPLPPSALQVIRANFSLASVFYWVGGFIVLLGVSFLFAMNWSSLPSLARILATFGSGLVFLFVGILLKKIPDFRVLANVFAVLSIALIPGGIYVAIGEYVKIISTSMAVHLNIFLILFLVYGLLYYLLSDGALGFGTTVFGAAASGFAIAYATQKLSLTVTGTPLLRMILLLTIVVGIVFALIGFIKQKRNAHPLVYELFYLLGLSAVLSGIIGLVVVIESLPLFYFFQSLYIIIPLLLIVAAERWRLFSLKFLSVIYWISGIICSPFSRWSLFSFSLWQTNYMPFRVALVSAIVLAVAAIVFVSGRRRGAYPFFLNNLSALVFLGSLMGLAFGNSPESVVLLLISPLVIFFVYYLAVRFNFKSYLVWNTVYLLSLIFHIGNRFFPKSTLSYPILILVSGIVLIGAGYLFFQMRKQKA